MTKNVEPANDLKLNLRNFIIENFLFGEDPGFTEDASFLQNGIIDSMGFLELINFLESSYGINIKDNELVPENMDSLVNLSNFLIRKLRTASDPDSPRSGLNL